MAQLADQLAQAFKAGHHSGTALSDHIREQNGGSYTKAEVNYRQGDENGECGDCKHFDGTSKCDIVAGRISPTMVCDKYEAGEKQPDDPNHPDAADIAEGESGQS